jgi:hypothetical protein
MMRFSAIRPEVPVFALSSEKCRPVAFLMAFSKASSRAMPFAFDLVDFSTQNRFLLLWPMLERQLYPLYGAAITIRCASCIILLYPLENWTVMVCLE